VQHLIYIMRSRQSILSLLFLGSVFVSYEVAADPYFDYLQNHPRTMVATAYKNSAEVEADIKAENPDNRGNPPIYDSAQNAARWSMKLGVGSPDQLRPTFPLVSSGNLLVVWEARWDAAFAGQLGNLRQHKAFQLSRDPGSGDIRRIEIRTRFNQASGNDVAMIDARGYVWNPSGAPLPGQINTFAIASETWTRFWALVDFDRKEFSLWVSDENRSAVQLFDGLSYSNMNGGLDNFWFEFNTSQTAPGMPNTAYIWGRHFAALRDINDANEIIAMGSPVRPNPPDGLEAD